jgi:hypothetical protein
MSGQPCCVASCYIFQAGLQQQHLQAAAVALLANAGCLNRTRSASAALQSARIGVLACNHARMRINTLAC